MVVCRPGISILGVHESTSLLRNVLRKHLEMVADSFSCVRPSTQLTSSYDRHTPPEELKKPIELYNECVKRLW